MSEWGCNESTIASVVVYIETVDKRPVGQTIGLEDKRSMTRRIRVCCGLDYCVSRNGVHRLGGVEEFLFFRSACRVNHYKRRTAQLTFVPRTIDTDPYKRTIALFISEVLYHVLRHPMSDEPMFDFIAQSIQELDETDKPQNFHLSFLVGLAAKLGFAMSEEPNLPRTRAERQKQLRALCAYFEEHVETWKTPRSLDVLMEVFD